MSLLALQLGKDIVFKYDIEGYIGWSYCNSSSSGSSSSNSSSSSQPVLISVFIFKNGV